MYKVLNKFNTYLNSVWAGFWAFACVNKDLHIFKALEVFHSSVDFIRLNQNLKQNLCQTSKMISVLIYVHLQNWWPEKLLWL